MNVAEWIIVAILSTTLLLLLILAIILLFKLIKLSKEGFFKEAYDNTFEPFYKGTVKRKYFLLDDLYNAMLR